MKILSNLAPYRYCFGLLVAISISIVLVGCGRSAGNVKVDQTAARDACKVFLDAWKSGKASADLKPKINGADYAWASGQKLVSFEILPDGINDGTSLHVSTLLVLQDAKGRESKSKVSYSVGTSPVITVIRDES